VLDVARCIDRRTPRRRRRRSRRKIYKVYFVSLGAVVVLYCVPFFLAAAD
ncbi:MAG: hypothetical protein ACI8RD_010996, partial [Bacillariaceae sp.]|jgi:hypothetical protein